VIAKRNAPVTTPGWYEHAPGEFIAQSSGSIEIIIRMGLTIEEDIGQMAGAIWYALNTHGELSLAQLKKLVEGKGPIFEWAIGWLAREGKVVLTPKKRSFSIRLK